jgi:hypothetical protein
MNQHSFNFAGLGLSLLLMPTVSYAQIGGATQSNVPMIASGQMPTAVPTDDQAPTNVFQMRLAVGARYDDNAQLGLPVRRSDIGYNFSPSLAFVQTLRRVDWGVSYGPGVDVSQHRLFADQFTNDFGGHVTWFLSKHQIFSAQQNYILSTDPFQQFGSQPFTTIPGPIVSPNQSIFLSNFRRTSSLSQAQYSYQLSAHTTFGMGGSFDLERYRNTSASGASMPLINSQIASGQAYLSHQFSARNQLGFQYGAQVLKFQQADARTTTHTFSIFDELKLSPNSSLTVYGGPEYSLTSNQVELNAGFFLVIIPVKANTWSWSGGGIYTLRGQRGAMVLNYSRRVSDGGGLTGAVELDGGSADFSWKLTQNWSWILNLAAADDQLLAVKSSQDEMRTYSATFGLSRRIFRNMSMNLFFERLNQVGSIVGFASGNHDLAGMSFEYNFVKPVGR